MRQILPLILMSGITLASAASVTPVQTPVYSTELPGDLSVSQETPDSSSTLATVEYIGAEGQGSFYLKIESHPSTDQLTGGYVNQISKEYSSQYLKDVIVKETAYGDTKGKEIVGSSENQMAKSFYTIQKGLFISFEVRYPKVSEKMALSAYETAIRKLNVK